MKQPLTACYCYVEFDIELLLKYYARLFFFLIITKNENHKSLKSWSNNGKTNKELSLNLLT